MWRNLNLGIAQDTIDILEQEISISLLQSIEGVEGWVTQPGWNEDKIVFDRDETRVWINDMRALGKIPTRLFGGLPVTVVYVNREEGSTYRTFSATETVVARYNLTAKEIGENALRRSLDFFLDVMQDVILRSGK